MYANGPRPPRQQPSFLFRVSRREWILLGVIGLIVLSVAQIQASALNALFWGAALVGTAWGVTAWRRRGQEREHVKAVEAHRQALVGQWQALDAQKRRLDEREQTLREDLEEEYQAKPCGLEEREREIEEWEYAMRTHTLEELRALTPTGFELAMCELLFRLGFVNVRHVGGSGDQGVDLTCETPDGESVVVQCKRYREGNTVAPRAIRELLGSMMLSHANRGLFITTSSYTEQAIATLQGHDHVELVDGADLARMAMEKLLLNPFAPGKPALRVLPNRRY